MGLFAYSRIMSSALLKRSLNTPNFAISVNSPILFSTPSSIRLLSTEVSLRTLSVADELLEDYIRKIVLSIVRIA